MTATTMRHDSKLRLFLADDHAIFRDGLKALINAQPDMAVVGEAADGREAWERIGGMAARQGVPAAPPVDVVVMDVSMPGWNGIEATGRVRRSWPAAKVLALSMHEDRSYLRSLLEAGAAGYVLKRSAADELIRAIRAVAGGGTYLDPSLSATVAESLVRPQQASLTAGAVGGASGAGVTALRGELYGARLSEREADVLRLIAQGYTNKEIGVQLGISVKTVETYKARSMEKLGLDSRADIVRYALQRGWLSSNTSG